MSCEIDEEEVEEAEEAEEEEEKENKLKKMFLPGKQVRMSIIYDFLFGFSQHIQWKNSWNSHCQPILKVIEKY